MNNTLEKINKPDKEVGSLHVLAYFLKRHLRRYSLLLMLGLVIGVVEALNLAVFLPMLNGIVGTGQFGTKKSQSLVIQFVDWMTQMIPIKDAFVAAGTLFLFLTILKGILSLLYEYRVAEASGNILKQYKQELVERFRLAPLSYFEKQRLGAVLYNLTNRPVNLSKVLYIFPRAFNDFLRFGFVLLLLLYMEPMLTLTFSVGMVGIYWVIFRPLSRYCYKESDRKRISDREMSAILTEWLRGLRQIRTAGADAHWIDGFSTRNEVSRASYVKSVFILASPRHFLEMAAFTCLMVGILVAYSQEQQQFSSHMTTIGFFAMGLVRILPSFSALTRFPLEVRTVMPDVEGLYRVLMTLPEFVQDGVTEFNSLSESISLENVTVKFDDRENALDGITLKIRKGEVSAFVGSSGAGKTTLLNVLIGAQAVSSGQVLYDNHDLNDLNKTSVLRKIGYVGQDVLLFHGTILQNIAYFTNVPIEAIKNAANIAEISDFIESLPNGYDTMVGEGGVNFSGGQAQRLAIARAIVNNPEILILDEATSALDTSSEKMVVEALQHASENRTVIMVTHRLATVKWADQIYVMDKGCVVEHGSWNDLIQDQNSTFHKMCNWTSPASVDVSLETKNQEGLIPDNIKQEPMQ